MSHGCRRPQPLPPGRVLRRQGPAVADPRPAEAVVLQAAARLSQVGKLALIKGCHSREIMDTAETGYLPTKKLVIARVVAAIGLSVTKWTQFPLSPLFIGSSLPGVVVYIPWLYFIPWKT